MDLAGRPLLAWVIERARVIPGVERVVVATSDTSADRAILELARSYGVAAYAGSEHDVLDRYLQAAARFDAHVIVRITADCPLLDPEVSGRVMRRFGADVDYVSNTNPPTYPDGLDTEVFSLEALRRAWSEATLSSDREHVTPYIWRHPDRFRIANIQAESDWSNERWTVDEAEDLAFARAVYARLSRSPSRLFGMSDVLALLDREPGLRELNARFARNQGYMASLRRDEAGR